MKIKLFLLLMSVALLGTSCSKDEDKRQEVQGYWDVTENSLQSDSKLVESLLSLVAKESIYKPPFPTGSVLNFTATEVFSIQENGYSEPLGSYTLKGNTLIISITDKDGADNLAFNLSLKEDDMTLSLDISSEIEQASEGLYSGYSSVETNCHRRREKPDNAGLTPEESKLIKTVLVSFFEIFKAAFELVLKMMPF